MQRALFYLSVLSCFVAACGPALPAAPPAATPEPSPTPSHIVAVPWLLPQGQYLFVEAVLQIDSTLQSGIPTPMNNDNMPTYDFNPAAGTLLSRAGFMPPMDSKVIIGVRRSLRGALGTSASSIVTAYSKLPAIDPDVLRVVAVDSDGSARFGIGADEFILKPLETKDVSASATQSAAGASVTMTTQMHLTNFGIRALSRITASP